MSQFLTQLKVQNKRFYNITPNNEDKEILYFNYCKKK